MNRNINDLVPTKLLEIVRSVCVLSLFALIVGELPFLM